MNNYIFSDKNEDTSSDINQKSLNFYEDILLSANETSKVKKDFQQKKNSQSTVFRAQCATSCEKEKFLVSKQMIEEFRLIEEAK